MKPLFLMPAAATLAALALLPGAASAAQPARGSAM